MEPGLVGRHIQIGRGNKINILLLNLRRQPCIGLDIGGETKSTIYKLVFLSTRQEAAVCGIDATLAVQNLCLRPYQKR